MGASGENRASRRAGAALLLVVLTCLVYAGVRDAGFVVDDHEYVEANATLEAPDGLRRIWTDPEALPHHQYYPVTLTSFWLEHQLWGKDPLGYHVVNVVLHALNAVLLFRLLRRLELPAAWFAAAAFALHPVQVESVAWITERKNVLLVCFVLLSTLAYVRFLGPPLGPPRGSARARLGWYLLALVLFTLAVLSKTSACALPAALLLILWMKRFGRLGRNALVLAPFFLIALGLGVLSAWAETQWVGAQGEQWDETTLERVLIAGRAVWFYATKLLWPAPISFNYERWDVDTSSFGQWLFPLGAVVLPLVLFALRGRIGRGPVVAVLLFGGVMLPTLGFIEFFFMRYSYVSDHLQYLASASMLALYAETGRRLLGRLGSPLVTRSSGALVLLALGALTMRRVPAFESDETLWRVTARQNPEAWVAHMLLGWELYERGAYDEAIDSYDRGIPLAEEHPRARIESMRGMALLSAGRLDDAIEAFRRTLEVKPTHVLTHYHLGRALVLEQRPDRALKHFRAVLMADEDHAEALRGYVEVALALEHPSEAEKTLEWWRSRHPESAWSELLFGRTYEAFGRTEEARRRYRRCRELDPGNEAARRALERLP